MILKIFWWCYGSLSFYLWKSYTLILLIKLAVVADWIWILKTLKYFKILKITVDGLNHNLNLGHIYLKTIDLKTNF